MAGARSDIMAGRAYVELWVKNNRFLAGLRAARQRLQQFGGEMQTFGRQIAMMSGAVVVPAALATKTFADFDDAMRQVKAVTGATADEFAAMTAQAKQLGATTSFTAIEVASLKAELGRAGFDPSQIDAMTESVLNLARATGTEAAMAAGIMSASIRQFNLDAGDAGRVADGLTAAANKSFNTVEQLGEALSYAGRVAADFGMSIEDTLAVLGGLGNVGIQASNAGTALRRLLTLSGADAERLQGIFGVAFTDAAGNARPLVDVLGEVNEATKDMSTGDRAAKFSEAFGLLGITGASAIGRSVGDIRELQAAIADAGGTAAQTAKEMDSGLGGSLRILMSAFEGTKIAIGEAMAESMQSVTEFTSGFLGGVTELVGENKELVSTFVKVAAVIGGIGGLLFGVGILATAAATAIGGLSSIFGGIVFAVTTAIGVFGGLLAILSSPWTLAVVAIAGVGAAILRMSGNLDTVVGAVLDFRQRFTEAFDRIAGTARQTFRGVVDALTAGELRTAATIATTGLQLAFAQGLESLNELTGSLMGDVFGTIVGQIAEGDVAGAWNTVVLGMSSVWESFTNSIVEAFTKAARAVSDTWRATVDGITNYILQQAGQGGVFGAIFEQLTGVNVQEEMRRNARMDAQRRAMGLGGNDGADIFDQVANGTYSDPATKAAADKMVESIAGLQSSDAAEALDDAVSGSSSGTVERLQKELDALMVQAEESRAAMESGSGSGSSSAGKTVAGARGAGGSGASAVTSSIHGLIALGQGVSRDPMIRAVDKQTAEMKKIAEKADNMQKRIVDAIENNLGISLM